MLRFLKTFRLNSFLTGKIQKYLLYAFGEILLVVLGILIALQINNMNTAAKERDIERALLIQVKEDLTNGMRDAKGNIRLISKGINSGEILLQYMHNDYPYHDSLAGHFATAFVWSRLGLSPGGYETLKSHGLELIQNADLRNDIIDLFENRISWLKELENITQDYAEDMRRFNGVNYFKSTFVDFGKTGYLDFGRSVPKDYEKLKTDESFRYHLESHMHLMKLLNRMGNQTIVNRIENLIQAIQDELDL